MKFRLLILFLSSAAIISSCSNGPDALDIPKKCFPPASYFTYFGEQNVIDSFLRNWPVLLYPNVFTPNGKGIVANNTFSIRAGGDLIDFEWQNLTIYNKRKQVVKKLDGKEKWDGTDANGDIKEGMYGFRVEFTFENGKSIYGYGAFCLRTCFTQKDDLKSAVFMDQLHPRLGFIYGTQEDTELCN